MVLKLLTNDAEDCTLPSPTKTNTTQLTAVLPHSQSHHIS